MPGFMPKSLLAVVIRWQLVLRARMTALAHDIEHNPWGRSFWLFMLLSLAYGMAHALGPGHGKAFAVAYFMERQSSPWLGLLFGNLSMFFHVLSAGVLIFAGTYLLQTMGLVLVDNAGVFLEGMSFAMLTVIGLCMVVGRVAVMVRKRPKKVDTETVTKRGTLALTALAAGLVPCPGASLILVFCISLGLPMVGALSLVAISLGMGATISLFAVATIVSRTLALRLTRNRGRLFSGLQAGISLLGGLAMSVFGALMFTGWWYAA